MKSQKKKKKSILRLSLTLFTLSFLALINIHKALRKRTEFTFIPCLILVLNGEIKFAGSREFFWEYLDEVLKAEGVEE